MKTGSLSKGVFVMALHVALQLQRFAAGQLPVTLTAGGCGPSSLSAAGPRIVWTPPTANARGNFTLTSAASNSSSRYVSFAFATGPNMDDAILVVDCYELSGVVTLGTSKNSIVAGSGVNIADIPPRSEVQLMSATKRDGVLTCSFAMQFPATLEVYVLLAIGNMSPISTASSPRKLYHTSSGRFASTSTIGQILPTTAVTSLSTSLPVSPITSMLAFTGFSASSPSAGSPRVVWTVPAVKEWGNFTLATAASSYSSNRYVSFAFASGRRMSDTFTIIDCLEIAGVTTLGTSKNTPSSTNVNDPDSLNQVHLQSATVIGGVLTCSFAMKFPPNFDVYAILATGPLAVGASVSSPTKQYHGSNGRFSSEFTIGRLLSSSSTTTLAPTTLILQAAVTLRLVCWP